jgi:hypothetical protein
MMHEPERKHKMKKLLALLTIAIGAVAAIGCFDLGLRSAGVPEDFE